MLKKFNFALLIISLMLLGFAMYLKNSELVLVAIGVIVIRGFVIDYNWKKTVKETLKMHNEGFNRIHEKADKMYSELKNAHLGLMNADIDITNSLGDFKNSLPDLGGKFYHFLKINRFLESFIKNCSKDFLSLVWTVEVKDYINSFNWERSPEGYKCWLKLSALWRKKAGCEKDSSNVSAFESFLNDNGLWDEFLEESGYLPWMLPYFKAEEWLNYLTSKSDIWHDVQEEWLCLIETNDEDALKYIQEIHSKRCRINEFLVENGQEKIEVKYIPAQAYLRRHKDPYIAGKWLAELKEEGFHLNIQDKKHVLGFYIQEVLNERGINRYDIANKINESVNVSEEFSRATVEALAPHKAYLTLPKGYEVFLKNDEFKVKVKRKSNKTEFILKEIQDDLIKIYGDGIKVSLGKQVKGLPNIRECEYINFLPMDIPEDTEFFQHMDNFIVCPESHDYKLIYEIINVVESKMNLVYSTDNKDEYTPMKKKDLEKYFNFVPMPEEVQYNDDSSFSDPELTYQEGGEYIAGEDLMKEDPAFGPQEEDSDDFLSDSDEEI